MTDFSKYGAAPTTAPATAAPSNFSKYGTPVAGARPSAQPTQAHPLDAFGSLLQAGTNVSNFLGGKGVSDTFGAEIAKLTSKPDAKQFIDQPTTAQTTGSALQLGVGLVPAGRVAEGLGFAAKFLGVSTGLAGKIGTIGAGAATGYGFDVGQNLQDGNNALTPGAGAAIGAAIPGAGLAAKAAKEFAGDQAPRVINSLIKPLLKDFSYGKDPGRTVAELGIKANNFEDLVNEIYISRQAIGSDIADLGNTLSTKAEINITHSLDSLTDAMKEAARQNNPTVLKRLQDIKRAITNNLEPAVDEAGTITIQSAGPKVLDKLDFNGVRKVLGEIGDMTQFTGNPSDDKSVNMALKKMYGQIKEASIKYAESVDPAIAEQFKKLTGQYADLTSAEIATKYRDKIVQRSNLVSLSPQVAGIGTALLTFASTGGAATPAILAGVAGAAIDKLASTPGFKTRLAAILSEIGRADIQTMYSKIPWLEKILPFGELKMPGDTMLDGAKNIPNQQGGFIGNPLKALKGLFTKKTSQTEFQVGKTYKIIDKKLPRTVPEPKPGKPMDMGTYKYKDGKLIHPKTKRYL